MPTIQSGLLWLNARHSLASSVLRLYSLSNETNLYESKTGATGGTVTGSIVSTSLGNALAPGRSVDGSLTTASFGLATDTAFSVSIWVYPENSDTSVDAIVALGGATFGSGTTFGLYANVDSNGYFYATNNTSAVQSSVAAFTANAWNHVVFTYAGGAVNATNCKLYVNGSSVALTTTGTGASITVASNPIEIGADRAQGNGDRGFRGKLQNLAIFSGALTSGNVSTLYSDQFGLYEQIPAADAAWAGGAWSEGAWGEAQTANAGGSATGAASGAWTIRALGSGSIDGAWTVREAQSATLAGAWTLRNNQTSAFGGSWVIQAPGQALSSFSGAWELRNQATAETVGAWTLRNAVEAAAAGGWTLRNTAAAAQAGGWSIQSPGVAFGSYGSAWSVRAAALPVALSGAWTIRAAGPVVSMSGGWSVRREQTAQAGGGWSIAGESTASAALTCAWSVRNASAPAQATGAWSIRNGQSASLPGAWVVRNAASAQFAGAWSTSESDSQVVAQSAPPVRRRVQTGRRQHQVSFPR